MQTQEIAAYYRKLERAQLKETKVYKRNLIGLTIKFNCQQEKDKYSQRITKLRSANDGAGNSE